MGHSQKSVAHFVTLTAAIVCPKVLDIMLQKRLYIIRCGDGGFYKPRFVKVEIGNCVHNAAALEKGH